MICGLTIYLWVALVAFFLASGQADLLWVVHDVRKTASYCILDNGVHILGRKLRRVILEIHHRSLPQPSPTKADPLVRILPWIAP